MKAREQNSFGLVLRLPKTTDGCLGEETSSEAAGPLRASVLRAKRPGTGLPRAYDRQRVECQATHSSTPTSRSIPQPGVVDVPGYAWVTENLVPHEAEGLGPLLSVLINIYRAFGTLVRDSSRNRNQVGCGNSRDRNRSFAPRMSSLLHAANCVTKGTMGHSSRSLLGLERTPD